ncbi:DUF2059 domain-containing protein [Mesorhizobium sp. ZC-5]|uniref:DUF2059 domain-containing protein n=1 Tax=Mesorhizobium sp. ZC-5 TaxID=2986066 RepID=UPI0021E85A18|nr:DUF2059 domain-containing protein [Mesorhizobium sp. ZC-5]MCV3240434.1 DUF2059 domain-containing protein [Mesorhizobium sp. ZC-5]
MTFAKRARRITLGLAAVASLSGAAFAQDISESHLKACRAAVDAINATDSYDGILPTAAQALKTQLIQKNPDLQEVVIKTVDEETIKMVSRRGDLEREAGTAYARVFNEKQCSEIAAFYQSETGLKLLADGPIVTRELMKAANIWQNGVARDLAQAVGQALATTLKDMPPLELPAQDGSQAVPPVDGAAPGTQVPVPEAPAAPAAN